MIPILFDTSETTFTSHGIGDLVDCSECTVNQTEEGEYELAFVYPVDSELFNELTINRYVLAKPNHYDNPQIFQIYGYGKQLNGQIQINCQHISYAMSGIPVKPFKDITTAASAIIIVFFMFILFYHSKVPRSSNGSVMPSGLSQRTEGTDAESSHKGVRYSID